MKLCIKMGFENDFLFVHFYRREHSNIITNFLARVHKYKTRKYIWDLFSGISFDSYSDVRSHFKKKRYIKIEIKITC